MTADVGILAFALPAKQSTGTAIWRGGCDVGDASCLSSDLRRPTWLPVACRHRRSLTCQANGPRDAVGATTLPSCIDRSVNRARVRGARSSPRVPRPAARHCARSMTLS